MKSQTSEPQVPKHVGIIMDGNRRWARSRHMPLFAGHNEGSKRIEPLVEYAGKMRISYLTFWAFSTENWERGDKEVGMLFAVFRRILKDPMLERLQKNGVRVKVIGDFSQFPKDIKDGVDQIIDSSKDNKNITATFALNYGGRAEILRAIKQVISEKHKAISERSFSKFLYTSEMPDPDFIIRTGGVQRLSGFLPWQSVYSELYFTDTLWPDFKETAFQKALDEYARRERRFGK